MMRLRLAARRELDLLRSRRVDTRELRTVCVALGPYRNLTTITAAILALHPHCQVLNHAGSRILNRRRLDFIRYPDPATFDAFTRYAIQISRGGRRGDYGGSITLSHAFASSPKLRDMYRAAYGASPVKDVIHSVFWKESLAVANHIRQYGVDLGDLLQENPGLRFLMPIRNPLDCAASNLKTGHASRFRGLDARAPIERVVLAILDEFRWFLELHGRYPDRFFSFFAHEFTAPTLRDMAQFLEIDANEGWCKNAVGVFEIEQSYDHPQALREFYANAVRERFSDHPEFAGRLLRFLGERPEGATL
ncbi:MAG: hypothetical protein HKM89_13585 [Gemmatimonadales bacterium]|nr:hypothetical protein [Gemmatimonadales bacterium]